MERRKFIRIYKKFSVTFTCNNFYRSGVVTNLSEGGIFINAEICFPIQSNFDVITSFKGKTLKVPVEFVRVHKSSKKNNGMGVKLANFSKEYLSIFITLASNKIY